MKKMALIVIPMIVAGLIFAFQARIVTQDVAYTSQKQCKMCHSEKHKKWEKTRMARAFDLLIAAGRETDEECLPCHTTGYGEGGFVDLESTPNLVGVQCESCHGPGGDHMGDPKGIIGAPPAAVCSKCHGGSLH